MTLCLVSVLLNTIKPSSLSIPSNIESVNDALVFSRTNAATRSASQALSYPPIVSPFSSMSLVVPYSSYLSR